MNLTLNVYICDFVFFLTLRGIAMLTYDDRINELSMSKLRQRKQKTEVPEVHLIWLLLSKENRK